MNAVERARLRWLSARLDACRRAPAGHPDDGLAIQVCEEALVAAREGNYGVGALIVDERGEVICRAHNQVFEPRFRSDGHAEMLALDRLEQALPGRPAGPLSLYVSLEPCPMCLARLKLSGIGRVRYLAPDPAGGMATRRDRLPPIWRLLHPDQDFAAADVSPGLRRVARRIFQINLRTLRRRLLDRAQAAG